MSTNAKLNAVTRLVLALSLLGFIATQSTRFVLIGALTIAAIVLYFLFFEKKMLKEGLTNDYEDYVAVQQGTHTVPTLHNPMMNVLLTEIKDNPTRKSALQIDEQTEAVINDKVKTKVLQSVGDPRIFRGIDNEVNFENSMRNFYTTANTSIPNDQKGFSDFLYGDMISAKEGNTAALLRNNVRLGQVTV